jgi:hypothetical protein
VRRRPTIPLRADALSALFAYHDGFLVERMRSAIEYSTAAKSRRIDVRFRGALEHAPSQHFSVRAYDEHAARLHGACGLHKQYAERYDANAAEAVEALARADGAAKTLFAAAVVVALGDATRYRVSMSECDESSSTFAITW